MWNPPENPPSQVKHLLLFIHLLIITSWKFRSSVTFLFQYSSPFSDDLHLSFRTRHVKWSLHTKSADSQPDAGKPMDLRGCVIRRNRPSQVLLRLFSLSLEYFLKLVTSWLPPTLIITMDLRGSISNRQWPNLPDIFSNLFCSTSDMSKYRDTANVLPYWQIMAVNSSGSG